ncbi:hypothetical protein AB835_05320 [Candidatus Endobugula sertula]|uniref:Serine aminopeptidase S33 domain-containing protein n=1 Tax=Candidatus Endobugula sertula TaxID=62101 RepID=A0A1D2QRE0_9GAMM|nr:hypothetical protein AB835_05320 [Candidatus Endobugula sertula]
MGCATIANYLLQAPSQLPDKIIFLAPLVRSLGWPSMRWLYFLLRPCIHSVPRKFHISSHDHNFNHFLEKGDPLQARRIPLNWLGAMEQWYQKVDKYSDTNTYPLSIIQGNDDLTVDWRYNLSALQRCFPNSTTKIIPGAKHRLINEAEDYWRAVEWVLSQLLGDVIGH